MMQRFPFILAPTLLIACALALPGCDQRSADAPPTPATTAAQPPNAALWRRVNDATVIAVNDREMQLQLAEAMAAARRSAADARERWTLATPEERALWAVKWAAPLAAAATTADSIPGASADAPPAAETDREPLARPRPSTTSPTSAPAATSTAAATSPGTTPQGQTADGDERVEPIQQVALIEHVEHVWVRPINWSPFRIEGILLSQPLQPLECGRTAPGEIVSFPIDELSDWIHFAADPATNPDAPFEGGYTVKALEDTYGRP